MWRACVVENSLGSLKNSGHVIQVKRVAFARKEVGFCLT